MTIQPTGSSLYHEQSVDPAEKGGAWVYDAPGLSNHKYWDTNAPVDAYNRGLSEYVEELGATFVPEEWIGKRVLDIGAGAYDRFGRQARKMGINVVSINPALGEKSDDKHRAYLLEAVAYDQEAKESDARYEFGSKPAWRRLFGRMAKVSAEYPRVVGAVAQALPFQNDSFDAVVSVYGTPHYLHHTDPTIKDDADVLAAYTPELRDRDKQEIRESFSEVVRVLRPGGRGFLTDDHRAPDQTTNINSFSPSDGTEVIEVLNELSAQGVTYEISEQPLGHDRGIKRVIVLQKPALG